MANDTPNALTADDALEFSRNLAQIGEGWWRTIALAVKLEVPTLLGLTRREWAETYHGYVKMPIEERREAVAELTAEGLSQREVADVIGVDHATVLHDQRALAGEDPPPEPVTDALDDTGIGESSPPEARVAGRAGRCARRGLRAGDLRFGGVVSATQDSSS